VTSCAERGSFRYALTHVLSKLDWQKWDFKVGFNQREGMVLYDVHYDGKPLFYRLSLSDMSIPYADPRHPFHRKAAFDLGDAGAGIMANNLELGCDCLGSIFYISGVLSDSQGAPVAMPNVVCVHEVDAGIGWKHTNYRTGRAALVRARELVVQSIITVANYEYIMAFVFNQAAEMHYEVRATGVLSTQPIDDDAGACAFGTRVHPGVLAVHHQHVFSLRADPLLDGARAQRLVRAEARAMPPDPARNPHGTGYEAVETPVARSAGLDLAPERNRAYVVQNPARRNAVSGRLAGYKVSAPPFQPLLAQPGSFNARRAEFATRAMWAVAYREDELYAAGRYTNQSRGGEGVAAWAARGDDILDKDLVLFVQFGMNHIPRVEDFPVMPCEVMRVSFKPVDFFERNPALDVPPSVQSVNKSVGLNRPHAEAVVEEGSCCSEVHVNGG
jgi:primary-amine oxidase